VRGDAEGQEGRNVGQRIAVLEERYDHLVSRLNHLDTCIDGVKEQAAENAGLVRQNMETWDRRWWVGLGFVGALIFLSGSGLLSLKELLALFAKLGH